MCEILVRAGYFDGIGENIRKAAAIKPEVIRAEKARLSSSIQTTALAIRNTFRIQAELDPASEAIRITAGELEILSQRKRVLEAELENLKAKENQHADVEDAIDDLKSRIEAFRRGLNSDAVTGEFPVTVGSENNVINMNDRRPQPLPGTAAEAGSDNLYIGNLQVSGSGGRCRT